MQERRRKREKERKIKTQGEKKNQHRKVQK